MEAVITKIWTKSTLNTEALNKTYYNGLTSEAKNMISNVVWNLGGCNSSGVTTATFYTAERESSVYSGNPTTWVGHIGLMYTSDYGYAVGGVSRNICLETNLVNYNNNNCYTNNWLYFKDSNQWTFTTNNKYSYYVFVVVNAGNLSTGYIVSGSTNVVRPNTYLKSNIQIIADENHYGSSTHPYELKINE